VSILPIRVHPDPVLRRKSRKVRKIDASIQKLIDDMIETMRDAPGVGLAAPQIGRPIRVIVVEVPDHDLIALINPEFVRQTREALHMSRQVFAFKLGVNPRTLERWEQGRSKPNEQAAALIWLVRKYPDTLERLKSLSASA